MSMLEELGITNEQVVEIADAVLDAARMKSRELGVSELVGAVLGIERVYNASEKMLQLVAILGPDLMQRLGDELGKAGAYDVLKEAEETINGN